MRRRDLQSAELQTSSAREPASSLSCLDSISLYTATWSFMAGRSAQTKANKGTVVQETTAVDIHLEIMCAMSNHILNRMKLSFYCNYAIAEPTLTLILISRFQYTCTCRYLLSVASFFFQCWWQRKHYSPYIYCSMILMYIAYSISSNKRYNIWYMEICLS